MVSTYLPPAAGLKQFLTSGLNDLSYEKVVDVMSSVPVYFYFSLQFSAIQKTVLRHDRLWSIAGISNMLSHMNEIDMPAIAQKHHGQAIVAGGGKFTARFTNRAEAEVAKKECVKYIATTLPMLEFQVSSTIWEAADFISLTPADDQPNKAIQELNDQKRTFRGYAVSFNPHLKICEECGEYPAQEKTRRGKDDKAVCRLCHQAFNESRNMSSVKAANTTLQKVYHYYLKAIPDAYGKAPAADFNDLFPNKENGNDERKRMAVWFSDLNNMNDKVPVWLRQPEDSVLATFEQFRDKVVELVARTLADTFPQPEGDYLPFRLVVAGGDDLCLVMAEKYVLNFARNLSRSFMDVKNSLPDSHPLSYAWLKANGFMGTGDPKPFGFGASFVVTSIHTPFSQIHRIGEDLMSHAKRMTDRQGNSVDWRIMAEEEAVTEQLLKFERPLFIDTGDRGKNGLDQLTFTDYMELRSTYKGKLSGSHLQQIVSLMQAEDNPWELERQLKLLDSSERDKSFSFLLRDKNFRDSNNMLLPQRIATLFELMTITGGNL